MKRRQKYCDESHTGHSFRRAIVLSSVFVGRLQKQAFDNHQFKNLKKNAESYLRVSSAVQVPADDAETGMFIID
jgi:hypothetical protein